MFAKHCSLLRLLNTNIKHPLDKMTSDEEDVLDVLEVILHTRRRNRFRVRPYLQRRTFNIYAELQVEDRFGLKSFFRCSESDYEELLTMILPDIQKNTTWRNDVISPEMRLGVTLRFLATGDSYTSLMYHIRISKQRLSVIIPEVCWALYNRLKGQHLKVPTNERDWLRISRGFETRWNFPHAIGALDGKHVLMEAPENTGSLYYNYKRTFSVVLLALVDDNYNFLYVNVGSQGRISDGGIFRNSTLFRCLHNNTLNIPDHEPLPGSDIEIPYVVLADVAFQLSDFLMTPYNGEHQQGSNERIFNYRLCRARRIVENAFGILCSVFQIFKKPLTVQTNTVIPVVLACVALHNYLRRNSVSRGIYSPRGSFDQEDLETGQITPGQFRNEPEAGGLQPLPRVPRRSSRSSREIRDEFAAYFVSERGMVPWQNNV